MVEYTEIDQLWFVVSPQNPLKSSSDLAPDKQRLEMVKLAIDEFSPKFQVCDIEMSMPRPSYTIDTMALLKEKYPDREFAIVMGTDSMDSITQWKDFKNLLAENRIIVYPRLGSNINEITSKYDVESISAPIMEISSTFIRNSIKQNKNMSYFIPLKTHSYITQNKLYL
jgi:nicotinate-nucleotide adenylyltransferase